ncbi:MAG: hypothetical protein RIB45_09835 [Marivibrio sp.]|uniref:hypothetical protein n=1 Tax=Marivibrio sp. TaxID=2039719 RepID=UPI0032EBAB9D
MSDQLLTLFAAGSLGLLTLASFSAWAYVLMRDLRAARAARRAAAAAAQAAL